METFLNIILIAIAGLIAYLWADRGLFSSMLHFVCVIAAGTIAFAVWEPLTFALMHNGWRDYYAWGVSLIGSFVLALLVLRVAMDKLAPANVNVPRWADFSVGALCGVGTGLLTTGILVIGLGHIQSGPEIMGFKGVQRDKNSGKVAELNSLWVPVHRWTAEFYGLLSVGSMSTGTPLRAYTPDLYAQATLFRDTADKGTGEATMPPEAVTITSLSRDNATIYVGVDFGTAALDYGTIMTITQSQIRLIEDTRDGSGREASREAKVVHPTAWFQPHSGYHKFDHISYAVTTEPGQERVRGVVIEFAGLGENFIPRFIQIKGTRFSLPEEERASTALVSRMKLRYQTAEVATGASIDSAIKVDFRVRSIRVSTNNLPSGVDHNDDTRRITSTNGYQVEFPKGGRTPRDTRITGLAEPEGTRVVQVDVSRGTVADLFTMQTQQNVPADSIVRLIDDKGGDYTPVGYVLIDKGTPNLLLDPVNRLARFNQLPQIATAGADQQFILLFHVTAGRTVTGLKIGDLLVGSANVQIADF